MPHTPGQTPTAAQHNDLDHYTFNCGKDGSLAGGKNATPAETAWWKLGTAVGGQGTVLSSPALRPAPPILAAQVLLPISLDISQLHSYARCGLSCLASVMFCLSEVHPAPAWASHVTVYLFPG